MKLTINVTGLREVQDALQAGFSTRRLNASLATALTRTAQTVSGQWQDQINARIDRPNPRTAKAATFLGASAQSLQATVLVKDRLAGTAPAEYLNPQEIGGARRVKKFERSLIAAGAMPAGYVTVPGRHATRDGYGGVSRGVLIAILSQIGTDYSPGYAQTISKSTAKRLATQAKRGRRYIAVLPAQAGQYKVDPGIYELMPDGSRKAVLLYKRAVSYARRLDLMGQGTASAQALLRAEVGRAISESAARLAARGAA